MGVMWRTPQELVSIGFDRSVAVMMNEGHNGLARCVRTRRVGWKVLSAAHEAGCRTLAMEALPSRGDGPSRYRNRPDGGGYLAQPEMIEFINMALGMSWTLVGYEADMGLAPPDFVADPMSWAFTNWREETQANKVATAIADLKGDPMLVWVGNGHHEKLKRGDWTPIGYLLRRVHRIEPFCIDQLPTVSLAPEHPPRVTLTAELRERLDAAGGTAGFTREDAPAGFFVPREYDAWLLSTDNAVLADPNPDSPAVGDG